MHRTAAAFLIVLLGVAAQVGAQPETRTGFLNVIWLDPVDGSEPEMRLYLSDGATTTRLQPVPGAIFDFQDLHQMNGRLVAATGAQSAADLPNGQRSADFNLERLQLEARPLPLQLDPSPLAGPQPWVSVLCKFADSVAEPQPTSFYQELLTGEFPSGDSFWREASYDAINIVGSIAVGWFTLPQPRSHYVYDLDGDGTLDLDFQRAANDCSALGDPDVDYTGFMGINFVFNQTLNCCAWGGGATLTLDGVTRSWRATWMPPWANTPPLYAHEMGHGFGFPHSSGPYGNTYDSKWDMMSWPYAATGPGTISFHKTLTDWIPQSRIAIVNPGTSITVSLERLALPTTASDPLMVKVPIRGSLSNFYSVEVRRRAGYDNGPSGVVPGDGVVIHHVVTGAFGRGSPAQVVDGDQNGNPNDAGAMWTSGETFADVENGIEISVLAESPTAATVTVTAAALCGYSLTPTSGKFSQAGGSGSFSVNTGVGCEWTVTNNSSSFLTVTDGSSGIGNGIVSYAVAVNAGAAFRTGTFTIDGQTFTVTQAPGCGYGVMPTSATFGGDGGLGSLAVTAAPGCGWTVTNNSPDFLTVTGGGNGTGNGTVSYTVAANGGALRTGTFMIGGQIFSVTQSAACTYTLTPTSVSFNQTGGPGSLTVTTQVGCGWTVTNNSTSFLTVTGDSSGIGDGTVSYTVAANTGVLRTGTFTIRGLLFTVTQAACGYSLSPTSAMFNQTGGPGSVTVMSAQGCAWTVTNNSTSFLTVTGGSSGTGNGTVTYTVAANGGTRQTGSFNIGGQVFTVIQGPTMTTDRTTLSFGAVNVGGLLEKQTSRQNVRVSFSSLSPSWTASSSAPWIQVTDGVGAGAGQFAVAVVGHPSLPATGTVTGSVIVTPTADTDLPHTVTVRLTLLENATTTAAPVGSFDTPLHLSTGLQGSIAITGWALDDTEVARVEIWRDLAPGETTPPFGGGGLGDGKVFVGNALFVSGARPDVEAANATTPLAYRAGWGYLMLTWGLWEQGNGVYTLHAFAYDNDGHATSLGSKTIAVSNATANKPFGAIDTPGYGGTASGSGFINFGWALTPPANMVDPRHCVLSNGNVLVSVDSGPLVPVVYGSSRPDIQVGFPGFSNATTAGGAYPLDAAALSNGVHTIGWLATDSCGRTDGMGSRFFTVTGSATDASPPTTTTAALATTSAAGAVAVADAGVNVGPVSVRSNLEASRLVHPNAAGVRVVEVAQGHRVEVQVGARRAGRHLSNGQRRALPIGSSYDPGNGTFYWQPAEGFLGSFDLEFAPVSAGPALRFADADRGDASAAPRDDDMRDRASERGDAGVVKLRVVVGPPMRMAIDTPRPGDKVGRSFTVAGWALDLAAAEGSGVDRARVFAYPVAGGPPVFLGVPVVGGARPDVGVTYGTSFVPSAYELLTTPLAPGDYDVVVYVHREGTNAFEAAQVVRVTIP